MNRRLPAVLALVLAVLVSPEYDRAQRQAPRPEQRQEQRPVTVVVKVTSSNGEPLATSAEVSVSPEGGGFGQKRMTNGNLEAQFELLDRGPYEVEVKAEGYKTERTTLEVDDSSETFSVNVTLSPEASPAGAESTTTPLAPKARKEMEKGIAAIKSGNFREAKTHLVKARKLSPGDSDINYFTGLRFAGAEGVRGGANVSDCGDYP